ncbi:MAG: hypothetical protein MPJ24_02645 [Pirellulaceae bacterium]|nr:hypothetical protein [Pirellulaceae bacterium]
MSIVTFRLTLSSLFAIGCLCLTVPTIAQEKTTETNSQVASQANQKKQSPPKESAQQKPLTDQQKENYKNFEALLDGVVLVGNFTTKGQKTDKLRPERYEIKSVKKLDEGDYWLFTTRVQYGNTDVTLPLPLQVKWAENTPVITLDNLTLPGLGSGFGARVLFHDNQYAGTWQHGKVGGLLFGTIEKKEKDSKEDKDKKGSK